MKKINILSILLTLIWILIGLYTLLWAPCYLLFVCGSRFILNNIMPLLIELGEDAVGLEHNNAFLIKRIYITDH